MKRFLLVLCLISLSACNDQNKIGVDDNAIDDDTNVSTSKLINDDINDNNTGSTNDINTFTGSTMDIDIINTDDKPKSVQDNVLKYIKNNFRSINPTNNNYDSIISSDFEGIDNINMEYTEGDVNYKLLLKYKASEVGTQIEITRLGYFMKQDGDWVKLTSIPKAKENDKLISDDDLEDTSTGDIVSDKDRLEDMIKGTGDTVITPIKGFDTLNIASMSLTVQYPKYWYWRWFTSNDAIAVIGFSKNQMSVIDDATILFKIQNRTHLTDDSVMDITLSKDRDTKTIYTVSGLAEMRDVLQQILDSAVKTDVSNTGTHTGSDL